MEPVLNNEKTVAETLYEDVAAASAEVVILPYEHDQIYEVEKIENLKRKPFYAFVKRLFDFLVCFTALAILFPIMLIVAIIIKCTSKGPIFYIQKRLGHKGKTISVPKFRTMRIDAEKDGARWSSGDNDDRIYPFGRILRKTRLDELPQLWCCVIGTMSLIGPRPEREIFATEFEKYIPGFSQRLLVKPGITGWAQVNGGYDLKPEEKIIYDIEYIKKRSILMEIKIMFKTIGIIFSHKGAK